MFKFFCNWTKLMSIILDWFEKKLNHTRIELALQKGYIHRDTPTKKNTFKSNIFVSICTKQYKKTIGKQIMRQLWVYKLHTYFYVEKSIECFVFLDLRNRKTEKIMHENSNHKIISRSKTIRLQMCFGGRCDAFEIENR